MIQKLGAVPETCSLGSFVGFKSEGAADFLYMNVPRRI